MDSEEPEMESGGWPHDEKPWYSQVIGEGIAILIFLFVSLIYIITYVFLFMFWFFKTIFKRNRQKKFR